MIPKQHAMDLYGRRVLVATKNDPETAGLGTVTRAQWAVRPWWDLSADLTGEWEGR